MAGGEDYYAPMQTLGALISGKRGTEYKRIVPSYRGGKVRCADFSKLFPPFVMEMLRAGLVNFG